MKKLVTLALAVLFAVSSFGVAYAVETPSETSLPPLSLTRTLRYGQRLDEVKKLQQYLIDNGFLAGTTPTNYFGPKTLNAVKLLQKKLGVTADGILGVKSRAMLGKMKGIIKKISQVAGCTDTSVFSSINGEPCDGSGKGVQAPNDPPKKNPDDTKNQGGGEGGDGRCDTSTPIALTTTLLGAPSGTPTSVTTATGGVLGASWLNFKLSNPTDCPTKVSKVQIHIDTNDMTTWPPVQNVKLMHGSTQLGATLMPGGTGATYASGTVTSSGVSTIGVGSSSGFTVGDTVKIDGSYLHLGTAGAWNTMGTITAIPSGVTMTVNITSPATIPTGATSISGMVYIVGPRVLTFLTPAYAVTIGAHSSEDFSIVTDSRNVNAQEYGYTLSSSGALTSGTLVYFKIQLIEFLGTASISGVVNDQLVSAGTILPTIITPTINIY
ncbi:MAG: peptidoglycan-binding protein [Candidatus Pacebacteria bacterium]|nr:peptidoglycan-binding protein [Candidatus Paceibacterota bacterium]